MISLACRAARVDNRRHFDRGKYTLRRYLDVSWYKAIRLLVKPVHASDSIFISRIKRLISPYLVFHLRAASSLDRFRWVYIAQASARRFARSPQNRPIDSSRVFGEAATTCKERKIKRGIASGRGRVFATEHGDAYKFLPEDRAQSISRQFK